MNTCISMCVFISICSDRMTPKVRFCIGGGRHRVSVYVSVTLSTSLYSHRLRCDLLMCLGERNQEAEAHAP